MSKDCKKNLENSKNSSENLDASTTGVVQEDTKYKTYRECVLKVSETIADEYEFPQKKHYNEKVAALKSSTVSNTEAGYTAKQVNPSVSKVIDELSQGTQNALICYRGKYYFPNIPKFLFRKLSEEYYAFLNEKISLQTRDVCLISYNMCAFFASAKNEKISVEECLLKCLGEDCYAIKSDGDFFFVFVKCTNELAHVPDMNSKEYAVISALEDALVRIYEDSHTPLKKRPSNFPSKNEN